VARRLDVDEASARPITSAVLETFAQRITPGQARDLMAQLDPLLQAALREGLWSADPAAAPMSAEMFLRHVGRREGLVVDDAALAGDLFRHARAVLETLAEAISTAQWHDIAVEMPADYHRLMPVRTR
jgi:uncharacterized protein (DUF2267 family)